MSYVDQRRLEAVLADLVARDVLSAEQSDAVTAGLAEQAPGAPPPSPLRARLVEAAAYLGAALVAAGVIALIAQSWPDLTVAARVAVLAGAGAVAYAVGLVVALGFGGGRATVREPAQAPRRRVSGALTTLGAVLVAAAVPAGAEVDSEWPLLAAGLVVLALVVPAQVVAPSAVTELALFGSSMVVVSTAAALVTPPEPPWDGTTTGPPPARGWDYVQPLLLGALGLLWAGVVSRLLTLPVVAQVVGLVVALVAATSLAGNTPTRAVGLVLLALFAVLGVLVFVRGRAWPWLVLSVLSVTFAVFVLVSDAGNPALAFLVAGLVLLATAGAGAWLGRRAPGSPAAPSGQAAEGSPPATLPPAA